MVGPLVARGIVAGIVAALLAFGFARTYGEPAVAVAIQLEDRHAEDARQAALHAGRTPPPEDAEIFSRDIQTGIGLFTGIVGVGAGIGALSGVLFAFARGRLGRLGDQATALLVGLMGLATFYLVPALKYPANPPTVGAPETIRLRTGLYFCMLGLSIAATVGSLLLRHGLMRRFDAWNAAMLAALAYLVALALVFTAMPSINEVPSDFPAVGLWNFRIASLGIQTILWIATAILLGYAVSLAAPAGTGSRIRTLAARS